MQCPYCKKEMTPGVVQSARRFYFTARPNRQLFYPIRHAPGDVRLSTHNWTWPTCPAYHCTACKKILIDCAEKE